MENDKFNDDEDFNITDHLIKKDSVNDNSWCTPPKSPDIPDGNSWFAIHKLPDIPDTYIPSKRELETPWWRRYENRKRKKK